MIEIKRVKILPSLNNINFKNYTHIFYGVEIDDRTRKIISEIKKNEGVVKTKIRWINSKKEIEINEKKINPNKINSFFPKVGDKVLIESTSLDFPELTYILRELSFKEIEIDIIYLEPREYKKKESTTPEEIDFDLSLNQNIFSHLPNFGVMNLDEKAAIVAPLGFEPMRLGQLLNSDDGREYSSITGLIAIPAYKVGWENRSIKSNLRHFKKTHQCSLSLCSSLNPYALYQKIDELWDAYEKIILAPLGTKPSTIAISLFLINNFKKNTRKKNISAVYDFPVKSIDRSLGIGKIHLYSMYSTI